MYICLSDCLLDYLSGVGVESGKIDFKGNVEKCVENICIILKFSNSELYDRFLKRMTFKYLGKV